MDEGREPTWILSLARAVAQKRHPGDEAQQARPEEQEAGTELDGLSGDPGSLDRVLAALFPDGVPKDARLIDLIIRLGLRLGNHGQSERLAKMLVQRAVQAFRQEEVQDLLTAIRSADNFVFWQALDLLEAILPTIRLSPSYAADWFASVADRIGNDLAGGRLHRVVIAYSEKMPDIALDVLDVYSKQGFAGRRGTLAYFILGTARTVPDSPLNRGERIRRLDRYLSRHMRPEYRLCYHQSLAITFQRTGVNLSGLRRRLERMMEGTDDEVSAAFFVLSHCARHFANDGKVVRFALRWLASHTLRTLPSLAKFHATALLATLAHHENLAQEQETFGTISGLLLSLQPTPRTDRSTWEQVLQFAVRVAGGEPARFAEFWTALAEGNPDHMFLRELDHNTDVMFWYDMAQSDRSEFVSLLLTSSSRTARQYGRFFFEHLPVTSFPEPVMAKIPERRLIVCLLEMVRHPAQGEVLARFFLALAPRMKSTSTEILRRFKNEALLQAVNFPGSFLEQLKTVAREQPFIQDVVDAAARYFDRVRTVQKSPINDFHRHEVTKAAPLFARKMSRSIRQGVDENSLLSALAGKPIQMLYGKQFATRIEGRLGDATDFHAISHTTEWPRLPSIDPDGEAYKALVYGSEVQKLESYGHEP